MSNETVLVTGANGFIAAWVIKYALEAGFRVRGTVRDTTNEKKHAFLWELPGAAERLELVTLNLLKSTQAQFTAAAKGCSFILHTASPVSLDVPKDPDNEMIKPAVDGTLAVLRAALATSTIKRVVVTSSTVSVGQNEQGGIVEYSEKDWTDETDPKASPYAKSKVLAEKAAWNFVKEHKPTWALCTINPSLVLGPYIGPDASSSAQFGIGILRGEVPMVPKLCLPVVDVRDVAIAHIRALQISADDVDGRRFIVFNEGVWMKELAIQFRSIFGPMGYKVSATQAPDFLLRFLSFFDAKLGAVIPFLSSVSTYDNQPSKDVLGIEYRPMVETVRDFGHSLVYFGHVKKLPGYVPLT